MVAPRGQPRAGRFEGRRTVATRDRGPDHDRTFPCLQYVHTAITAHRRPRDKTAACKSLWLEGVMSPHSRPSSAEGGGRRGRGWGVRGGGGRHPFTPTSRAHPGLCRPGRAPLARAAQTRRERE